MSFFFPLQPSPVKCASCQRTPSDARRYFMCAGLAGFIFYSQFLDPSLSVKQWARAHAKEREMVRAGPQPDLCPLTASRPA